MIPAQESAPFFEALIEYPSRQITPLHTPGHKGIAGPPGLEQLLTPLGLACDLPAMDATDYLSHPRSCLAEAQRLAAELYGADETFFLVNGSTIGVQAMLLAAVAPGEKVLLSRDFHISAFSSLVLTGAVPVYLPSRWLEAGGPIPPASEELERCLSLHPETRAVLLTHPSYYGIGRPLASLAEVCHRHGVPLLVDEAHGAHLRFLPPGGLPSAMECGADVVVQSVHKTVGSLVGTAQVHLASGGRIPGHRLQAMLNLLHSTSPNYLLLASLDLTRRWMWKEGEHLFRSAVERAVALRSRLAGIEGIVPLEVDARPELAGCASDPLRLVLDVSGLGLSGFQVERRLQDDGRILVEFSDARNVVLILGPADTPEVYDRLERTLRRLSAERPAGARTAADLLRSLPTPPMALTPREAMSLSAERVPAASALGRICGEMITLYPPGIPLVCPGERITAEVLDECARLAAQTNCVLASDPALETLSVLREKP